MPTNSPTSPSLEPDAVGDHRKAVEVAIAIVFSHVPEGERLLLCRRKADAVLGGYWEFPGGKCNPDEPPPACARREVEEETGLQIKVLAHLPIIEHTYPHAQVRLHPFVCVQTGGTLELREVADARWIAPATVTDYRLPEANGPLVQLARLGLQEILTHGSAHAAFRP